MLELLLALALVWAGTSIMRLVMYSKYILWYGKGMSEYRTNNWKGRREIFELWRAALDEMVEVVDAVKEGNLTEIVAELCDVNHALVTMVALLVFGEWLKSRRVYWILYILTPMTAWKHGARYGKYRCIRSLNHHNSDGTGCNHVCGGDVMAVRDLK